MLTILLDFIVPVGIILIYALVLPSDWKGRMSVKVPTLLGAGAFIAWRQSAYSWERLGFREDWTTGLIPVILLTILGFIVLTAIGKHKGYLVWTRNTTFAFVFYPLLGFLQQFLMLSFINVRLQDLGLHPLAIAAITSVAFMSLHLWDRTFMVATATMGFCFSLLFQYESNLIPFSFSHGWMATFFYYFVKGENGRNGQDTVARNLPFVNRFLHKLW